MPDSHLRSKIELGDRSGNMAGSPDTSTDKVPSGVAPSVKTGSGNKLILLLSILNFLITIGILFLIYISYSKEKNHPSVEDMVIKSSDEGEPDKAKSKEGEEGKEGEEKSAEGSKKKTTTFGKMINLEQFTVNLTTSSSASSKFVRANISLEVPTEDIENEVGVKMPQVRNTIIDLFNSKRPSDLSTSEGRDFIKEEIRNSINNFLVTGKVKGVFFTSFSLAG